MKSTRLLALALAAGVLPIAARAESELSVTLQGGGVKYDQALAGPSDLGAQYGVRVGLLPTDVVGLELGYLGTRSNVRDVVNGRTTTRLVTNGGYLDARVNFLPGSITPYVFAGYGLTNVKVSNEVVGAAGGLHGGTVSTLPFGGGIDANIGSFKLGGRFQYNYLVTDQVVRSAPTATGEATGNSANFYGFSIDLGASFR
jgi:Outer membrane protein beta-barrel domain